MVLRLVYLLAFFISLCTLIIYYETNSKKINKNYLMLFMTTLISNFGYAMSVHADTLEAALSGNLISYIGSIYTILFMLIVIVDMCNKRFFFFLRFGLFVYAMVISVIVATTKETNLFYIMPYIVKLRGLTVIKYTTGPAMYFYLAYIAAINISAMVTIIHSVFKKKQVSRKSLQILLCMLILGTLLYVIPLSLGIRFNFMPYTYILMEMFFIYFSAKTNTYDLELNLINVFKNRGPFPPHPFTGVFSCKNALS